MQKILIGVLALVALTFAAAHARLAGRLRILEGRLAAAEARPRPKPLALAPAPLPPVAAAPTPPPAPAVSTRLLDHDEAVATKVIEDAEGALGGVRTKFLVLNAKPVEQDLGLSEAQQKAVEELRKNRDLRTKVFKDQIQAIEAETQLAIRQLLNSEQQARIQEPLVRDFADLSLGQVLASPDVPKSGYLGVSATDAPGGGARIDQVMSNSAASAVGLQAGDVLLEYNGEKVSDFTGLSTKIRASAEGAAVALKIQRGGTEFTQNVVLGRR